MFLVGFLLGCLNVLRSICGFVRFLRWSKEPMHSRKGDPRAEVLRGIPPGGSPNAAKSLFVFLRTNPGWKFWNFLKLIGQYVSTFQWQYDVTVHPKSQLVSCPLSRNMWDSLIDHLFQLKGGVSDERSDWYQGVLSLLNGELKNNDFCCCSSVFCVGWFHPSNWEKASIRKGVFLWDCRDGLSLGCALQNWDSQSFWMLHSPPLGSWAGAAEVLIHLGHLSPWRIDFHGGIIRWILPKVVGVWIHWLCISHRSRLFCHLVILGKGLLLLLLAVKKPRPLEIFGMFALNRMAHWPLKMQRLLI